MTEEDRLFLKYRNKGSEEALEELTRLVSPWLVEITHYIVMDEEKENMIVKETLREFQENSNNYDPGNRSIILELLDILKNNLEIM